MTTQQLSGTTAIVTGASRGFGRVWISDGRGASSPLGRPDERSAAVPAAALAATLGLAAVSWVVAVRLMSGMDMGVATRLGPFGFFMGAWVAMMAAMMLPGAAPAAARRAQARGVRAVPPFIGSYLAVWALAGVAVFALYRPHGSLTVRPWAATKAISP